MTRALPGGLSLQLPAGTPLESAGDALAGRMTSSDAARGVGVQASWNEAPEAIGAADLTQIHRAWLAALTIGHQVPGMADREPATCAGHPCALSRGVTGDGVEYRAITWSCPPSRRAVHVLLSAPVGLDLGAAEEALRGASACHGASPAASPAAAAGPHTALPAAPGWRELSVTGTRRSYASAGGIVDVVVEEGPAPQGSPVEHVMTHADLWPALLTGAVGTPMPVEAPGAERVRDLPHGHDAVRVHGRLQPPAHGGAPAPYLFAETTIWVCPTSGHLVSVSAVSPDRQALTRARPILDAARCH